MSRYRYKLGKFKINESKEQTKKHWTLSENDGDVSHYRLLLVVIDSMLFHFQSLLTVTLTEVVIVIVFVILIPIV